MVASLESVASVEDYWNLLKPRVMSLVVFTGLVGLLLAPGPIHPIIAFAALLCTAVGSGAAGAINMWYERDIDALMDRTKNRPLPQGRLQPGEALGFGVTLAIGSVLVMYTLVTFFAAFYLALAILFYVFVYTLFPYTLHKTHETFLSSKEIWNNTHFTTDITSACYFNLHGNRVG